jgi:hypothetical protein
MHCKTLQHQLSLQHIAFLDEFTHCCNVAFSANLLSWAKSPFSAKFSPLPSSPSWQPQRHGKLAIPDKISLSEMMLSCQVALCGKVTFPDHIASLGKGGNRVAFVAPMWPIL